eukprot:CAMPEP_0204244976 /NCGR_PEP_ID=MMETSP0361-20130328/97334_1 /ASSEMBLY_ACC=CAM_ASM_000343 /TAXON_ID=268821 /ORGANISM="Scrippsiella Hangoei, Strain SHTV-5" /LENGTH=219 /DNA_ID=CAMNT_0051218083 /DNA_START=141 /DNA_END=798 /DNA_ORIENTATION=-
MRCDSQITQQGKYDQHGEDENHDADENNPPRPVHCRRPALPTAVVVEKLQFETASFAHSWANAVDGASDPAMPIQECEERLNDAALDHCRRPDRRFHPHLMVAEVRVNTDPVGNVGADALVHSVGDIPFVGPLGSDIVWALALVEVDGSTLARPNHLVLERVLHGQAVDRDIVPGDDEPMIATQLAKHRDGVLDGRHAVSTVVVVRSPQPEMVTNDVAR